MCLVTLLLANQHYEEREVTSRQQDVTLALFPGPRHFWLHKEQRSTIRKLEKNSGMFRERMGGRGKRYVLRQNWHILETISYSWWATAYQGYIVKPAKIKSCLPHVQ